jgi:uncharacterized membrane protein YhaH (DUF805 family)
MDAFFELFSTQGRANRAWYFWHILLDDLAIATLAIVLVMIGVLTGSPLVVLPILGVLAAGVWAAIAVTVKRLHDLDRPGWQWFLLGVPLYNVYLGLVLLFAKGTVGPNRFGLDPLAAPKVGGYIS